MFIDTHCHLNLLAKNTFSSPITEEEIQKAAIFIEEAKKEAVEIIITIGTDVIESNNSIILAKKYPDVFATIGIHPHDISNNLSKEINELKNFLKNKKENKIVGIGECGIDTRKENSQLQKDFFKAQIELALENDLALIIHMQDAEIEIMACLDEFKNSNIRGIMHCFTSTLDFAQESIKRGFAIGIAGRVTYPKNQSLRDIVKIIGVNNIVLETDSPFMPPQNIRGKQNAPKQIKTIAQYLTEFLNIDIKEIEFNTTETAKRIFKLK